MTARIPGSLLCTTLLLCAGSTAQASDSSTTEARKQRIEHVEATASERALARKARSEARLVAEGVPINVHLPAIEDDAEAATRSKAEVARRAMALLVVAMRGSGMESARADAIAARYDLSAHFTPDETRLLRDPSPNDGIGMSWRVEAAWTLLWALGYVETLGKPVSQCDVERAMDFMAKRDAKQFIADARLRPTPELLDQADLIYRYHWAVVDARVNGRAPPAGLEPGVTLERHYALNWLIGYMDQAWDDVTTDT